MDIFRVSDESQYSSPYKNIWKILCYFRKVHRLLKPIQRCFIYPLTFRIVSEWKIGSVKDENQHSRFESLRLEFANYLKVLELALICVVIFKHIC